MAGYFDSLFDENEPTGFFGGYRPSMANSPAGPIAPVGSSTPAPQPAPGVVADVLTYPDGTPVVDINTGQPFPRPDRLDMQNNIATGQKISQLADNPNLGDIANTDLLFAPLFVWGSDMDYQRPLGHPFGKFDGNMTNVSAYNVGVVGAAAGYDLGYLLKGAGLYNLGPAGARNVETPYGLSKERVLSIRQGYDDYKTGRWSRGGGANDPLSAGDP